MNWTYDITSGWMYDPDNKKKWHGYAGGDEGRRPEGINNPLMVAVKSVGPLPPGWYTFGEPVLKSHLGPFAIPLIPDKDNIMLGRGGFYCHGDTTPSGRASQGCIIVARKIRDEMWASDTHRIHVVVTM